MSTLAEKVNKFIVRTLNYYPTVKYVSSKYDTKNFEITYFYEITNRNYDKFDKIIPTFINTLDYTRPDFIYSKLQYVIIESILDRGFHKRIFYSENNKYIIIKFIKTEFTNGLLQIHLKYQILPSETLFDLLPEDMIYEILKVTPEDSAFPFSSVEIEKVYHRYILDLWKGYYNNFKNFYQNHILYPTYRDYNLFKMTRGSVTGFLDSFWNNIQILSDEKDFLKPGNSLFKNIYYFNQRILNQGSIETKIIGMFNNSYYFYIKTPIILVYMSKKWKYIWEQLSETEKYDIFKIDGFDINIIYQIVSGENML